jgi:hypothetical protein
MTKLLVTLRITLLVAGGIALTTLATSTAAAQRRNPVVGRAAAAPAPASSGVPYPGATATVDPRRLPPGHPVDPRRVPPVYPVAHPGYRQHLTPRVTGGSTVVYYVPVPMAMGYGYYPNAGSSVTDANGRPLTSGFDDAPESQLGYGLGTPDLTGAPYIVGDGGVMRADFGNGDTRTIPACATVAAVRDPDGRPRTIFYSTPADGLVLRAGQQGRVLGAPPAGAAVCYTIDSLGRVVLDY